MRGGAYKPRACRSRLRLSKASQENRPDVTASKTPELLQSHRDHSPVDGGLVQDATPSQTIKRPLHPVSTNDCSPAKRARLTQADTQRRPSRRSARLSGVGSSSTSRALLRGQIEAGAGTSTPERPGLTRRNTQLEAEVGQTKATKTEQPPNPLKRPSTTPPEVRTEEQERASPATLLRKRHIDSDGNDNEHQLKRARLTRKNLAEFNMAKKKGANKGANKVSVSGPPESTIESSSTKTTSITTSGFAILTYKNGILPSSLSQPPANLKDIRERHAQSRRSASPTESEFKRYAKKVEGACNEATLVVETSGTLLKDYDDDGYNRVFNQAFTGFPKNVGFNNGLSAPQPDFAEGPEMQEYRPFPIDNRVNGAVLYKDNPRSLALPHLAGEWKSRGKDMEEAKLQSAYDGAALVYARAQALSYLGKPDPFGHAEVTTFTTDGTNLNLFAHYATRSEDGTLEYHQYPIKSTNLIDSHQALKDGRRGLRNEQDHAKKQSYDLRDQLKEHWRKHRDTLCPVAEGALLPVTDGTFGQTSTDVADYVLVEQPCQPTPAVSSSVSSKSLPPVDDCVPCSSGQKRKASSSRRPSHGSSRPRTKAQEYWKLDANSGDYYHRHSDGKIIWLEDSDDGN
ncbi:hypothetical protein B0T17DRAFT_499792 [Bombardia bombarda]|uniref:DUF7924 domain-containing protein n=1 Tax=Bombardia bombarda TaxID=252184 RepID=A0AA39WBI0_9PEZI|nr:hypothetical protein B0T17DRAFT_499792 [Bombardia bombarda]